MPPPVLKSLADKAGKSLSVAERYWKEAKKQVQLAEAKYVEKTKQLTLRLEQLDKLEEEIRETNGLSKKEEKKEVKSKKGKK